MITIRFKLGKISSVALKDRDFRKIPPKAFVSVNYHEKVQMVPEYTIMLDFIHWEGLVHLF